MTKRISIFIYGVAAYAIFFATFLYSIGFVGGFLVPSTIDGAPQLPLIQALFIDIGLLGLFAVQHSVMARPAFKRWWTRIIPEPAERSTYVLASSLALIAMFAFWQPLGGMVWEVQHPVGRSILCGLFGLGWIIVLVSTFLINHFDLFGLRQVWMCLLGRDYTPLKFVTPGPYKHVRHPLYLGWFIAFWATPTMTAAHLIFALATTAYILIAIQLEERDLVNDLKGYAAYRKRVPMLIPRFRRGNRELQDAEAV
jgi:protein-S-isoprenylcysteine O-methyltransferase Ste14